MSLGVATLFSFDPAHLPICFCVVVECLCCVTNLNIDLYICSISDPCIKGQYSFPWFSLSLLSSSLHFHLCMCMLCPGTATSQGQLPLSSLISAESKTERRWSVLTRAGSPLGGRTQKEQVQNKTDTDKTDCSHISTVKD